MKKLLWIACIVPLLFSCRKDNSPETRCFYMGMTPWPPDFNAAGKQLSYDFIRDNCDMISHHFDDGVPWEEFLNGDTLPKVLTDDVDYRLSKTPAGKKILLSVAPLDISRKAKAHYRSDIHNDPRENEWQAKRFSDTTVITAYSNYLSWLIAKFHPDFVNYGVESNNGKWGDADFSDYKIFLDSVYHRMKRTYPALPFFLSFMVVDQDGFLSRARELEPFTDFITISAYPYSYVGSPVEGSSSPSLIPPGLFPSYADINPSKPFAVAETGYIAEDLVLPGVNKTGTPQWQEDYVNYIFKFCTDRHAQFLIWFCPIDYDAADNTFAAIGADQPLNHLWQDTGLEDEWLTPRPAYQVWKEWVKKNVVQ
ncbi:MAG TPA: hypothetical protein VFU15_14810 [Bacteroidia bacterium]|nr:hypothetical protein [Bacteroidia bacterium]